MAINAIKINGDNIYEWLCSFGYLMPGNEIELARFETLYPVGSVGVNEAAIDPFAIINGTRQRKSLSFSQVYIAQNDEEELRMAARKHADIPKEILDQIKRNQQQKSGDKPDDES